MKLPIVTCHIVAIAVWTVFGSVTIAGPPQGSYFAKKEYVRERPLPDFAAAKDKLPHPIYREDPTYEAMYWKTWELAFRNFHEPAPNSGFVTQFIDAAFNENIFLWDTCFLTMFCNCAHPLVPGIGSLDNFYAKQHPDGEICREIDRSTGRDYEEWVNRGGEPLFSRWSDFKVRYVGRELPEPPPLLTLDALNHPILAWAEMESFRATGDQQRLALVYEPLVRYYGAMQKYVRQGNGLYMTDWASMDNSPRISDLIGGGTAVDTSSQMVLFAHNLAEMAELLGKSQEAFAYRAEADDLAQRINRLMWDPEREFYFAVTVDGQRGRAKTIAAYWTLLAGVADDGQCAALVAELSNPSSFGRVHRVPTTPADQEGFDPNGGYWRGSVWAPTNTMVIRGLERYGCHDLAREIALEHLQHVAQVYRDTGTVWENYAPDAIRPGQPAKPDFVGWTGIVPITYFLECAIGLQPDARANRLKWTIRSPKTSGCRRYRFNGHVVDLTAEPIGSSTGKYHLKVVSDGAFELCVQHAGRQSALDVRDGKNEFEITPAQRDVDSHYQSSEH